MGGGDSRIVDSWRQKEGNRQGSVCGDSPHWRGRSYRRKNELGIVEGCEEGCMRGMKEEYWGSQVCLSVQ